MRCHSLSWLLCGWPPGNWDQTVISMRWTHASEWKATKYKVYSHPWSCWTLMSFLEELGIFSHLTHREAWPQGRPRPEGSHLDIRVPPQNSVHPSELGCPWATSHFRLKLDKIMCLAAKLYRRPVQQVHCFKDASYEPVLLGVRTGCVSSGQLHNLPLCHLTHL